MGLQYRQALRGSCIAAGSEISDAISIAEILGS
jgi:hypothetical protein